METTTQLKAKLQLNYRSAMSEALKSHFKDDPTMTEVLAQDRPSMRKMLELYTENFHSQNMDSPMDLLHSDPETFGAWVLGPSDAPIPKLTPLVELVAEVEANYAKAFGLNEESTEE